MSSTKGVWYLLDWYTAVWENAVLKDCLAYYGIDVKSYEELINQTFDSTTNLIDYFTMMYRGIKVQMRLQEVYRKDPEFDGEHPSYSVFDQKFTHIRVDMSGTALQNMRADGVDIDQMLRVRPILLANGDYQFHPTRADFAWDFVDVFDNFLDDLINCTLDYDGKNVFLRGSLCKPTSVDVQLKNAKVVRYGSRRSDKKLRIYDKLLQVRNDEKGTWDKTPIYGTNINSWIRIEMETRNDTAAQMLYSAHEDGSFNSPKELLKVVFDHYAMLDGPKGKVVKPWREIEEWETITPIIQNLQFSRKYILADQVVSSFNRVMKNILLNHLIHFERTGDMSCDWILETINDHLSYMNRCDIPAMKLRLNSWWNSAMEVVSMDVIEQCTEMSQGYRLFLINGNPYIPKRLFFEDI